MSMADWMTVVGWTLAALAVGAATYFRFAGQGDNFLDSFEGKALVARQAVAAVEQLWKTGQIKKDERFAAAAGFVRRYYPALTDDQIKMTVEAAVFWLKQAAARV